MIKDVMLVPKRLMAISRMTDRPWYNWFLERIGEPRIVLDMCGGYGLWYYGALLNGAKIQSYYSVDNDIHSLKQGKHLSCFFKPYAKNAMFVNHDIRAGLPSWLHEIVFDQVWMNSWWLPNRHQFMLDEAYRILKDDGILFLMFPCWMHNKIKLPKFTLVDCDNYKGFDDTEFIMYQLKK